MQEQSFEQMLNDSLKEIHVGEILTGKVISVSENEFALNIGYKADGIVKRADYSNDNDLDLRTVVKIGDEMEVKVKKLNDGEGQVVLSRKDLIQAVIDKRLKELFEDKGIHRGKVIKVNDGGLVIEIEPMITVFMPKSLISNKMENDLNKYLDQELEFYISEYKPAKRRCIADRKRILVDEDKKKREEAFSRIHEGDIVNGKIQSVLDYGVFVDLGGVDGLLHVTEMGWGKIKNPKKTYNVGDEIKVLIREINDGKVSLTIKFPEDNPWLNARAKYGIGNTVKGKVVRMLDYGAFVELEENVDALLHVSEISRARVKKPSDVLTIGQEIEAQVIDFNEAEHKISLSMKALEPEPEVVKEEDKDIVDVDIEAYGKKLEEEASNENTDISKENS